MSKDDKVRTLHIRNAKLWPSTLYVGGCVIKFITGSRGRSIKVQSSGAKPRHKPLHSKQGDA
jgi:hypothetical protein